MKKQVKTPIKQKILVIEDDVSIASLIGFKLKNHGFDTIIELDSMLALGHIKKLKPDLILLDLIMPGISGTELLLIIREKYPYIPVIILTAKTLEKDVIEHFRIGAIDYIKKPFSPKELVVRIENALRKCEKK